MNVNWDDVRYRGDAQDVEELIAHLPGDRLPATRSRRTAGSSIEGIREKLIKHGIRLSERLSPRIYRIFREVCRRPRARVAEAEVFCLPVGGDQRLRDPRRPRGARRTR